MAAPGQTYNTLFDDVKFYLERGNVADATVFAQIPRLIMMAQMRLAKEAKTLISRVSLTNTMTVGDPIIAKPARWRNTESFNFGTGVGLTKRTTLYLRNIQYCRRYWPEPSALGQPKYYADYDYEHWLVVPTPALAYPFEIIIQEEIDPVSDINQTNFYTQYAYDLLLHATLLEAWMSLKQMEKAGQEQGFYDRLLKGITFEQDMRKADKSQGDAG